MTEPFLLFGIPIFVHVLHIIVNITLDTWTHALTYLSPNCLDELHSTEVYPSKKHHRDQFSSEWGYMANRQFSNISGTQSPNINISRLILQLPLSNPLKPVAKLRMKMKLEQRGQVMLQLHLSDQQFNCLLRCVLYQRLYGISVKVNLIHIRLPWQSPNVITIKWPLCFSIIIWECLWISVVYYDWYIILTALNKCN